MLLCKGWGRGGKQWPWKLGLENNLLPAFHLVPGPSLPAVGQHTSQATRTPGLLFVGCGRQTTVRGSPWAWAGKSLSAQRWRKPCLQLYLPGSSSCPILYMKEEQSWRVPQRKVDQRLDKVPTLRSGAVPELGAWPQEQTFIYPACSREAFHAIFGWGARQKKKVRMTGSPILPVSMLVLCQLPGSFPFPLFFSSLLIFLKLKRLGCITFMGKKTLK